MPTHIVVPDERAEQLRRLAVSLNISVADAVGVLINAAVRVGAIPDELPGITVEVIGDQVAVDFGSFAKSFNRDLAKTYAGQIKALIDPLKGSSALFAHDLGIVRRGSGIKLTAGSGEKVVAPSVAADIARLINQAADELPADKPL